MLTFTQGDLFAAKAAAIVIPVNTVGVMGAGLAKQYKSRFPEGFAFYQEACDAFALNPGDVLMYFDGPGHQIHIFAATKGHWKAPSREAWVVENLKQLRTLLRNMPLVTTVALPPLGCGLGGLDWAVIRPHVQTFLDDVGQEVLVFEPQESRRVG